MPYRKNYKRTSGGGKKKASSVSPSVIKAIAKISKTQALKVAETKNAVQASVNNALNHNGGVLHHGMPQLVLTNLLRTQHGAEDNKTSFHNRIGDSIFPIGSKLMFQFRLPADRPNTTIKVWIVKYNPVRGQIEAAPSAMGMNYITTNVMLDSVDNERFTVVKSFTVKSNNSLWEGQISKSLESTIHKTMWIPYPKTQYQYDGDNGRDGKFQNYGIYAAAYDTSTTLRTDTIGYMDVSSNLYFKDP